MPHKFVMGAMMGHGRLPQCVIAIVQLRAISAPVPSSEGGCGTLGRIPSSGVLTMRGTCIRDAVLVV